MKKLLCTGNCQMSGIAHFLRRALPSWEIHDIPHLAVFYAEFSEEQIAAEHAWADLVLYHHKHDGAQDYPTKNPKIPLSVWFQSAPFMIQIPNEYWGPIYQHSQTYGEHSGIEYAVKAHDFDYESRWNQCVLRMKEKEDLEGVPPELKISELASAGFDHQLQLTCNHPTSLVFRYWANKICVFLGESESLIPSWDECVRNPNIAGLPCEESATTGARKHLGIKWGARAEDDESGRQIVRERLAKIL